MTTATSIAFSWLAALKGLMARLEQAGSVRRHRLSVETVRDQLLHNKYMKTSFLLQTLDRACCVLEKLFNKQAKVSHQTVKVMLIGKPQSYHAYFLLCVNASRLCHASVLLQLGVLIADRTSGIHGKVDSWVVRIGPSVTCCPATCAYSVSCP